MRALIDREVVQPVEGVDRLVGDVELAVPDSLHALLAARLDALDPQVRRLVADAAVLGQHLPRRSTDRRLGAKTNRRCGPRSMTWCAARCSACPPTRCPPSGVAMASPQQMLRQVAYDTLSRRDRKTRHLKVAVHLRTAFPGDGEEVADVIARHYLDALAAVPDDPDLDTGQIRDQAIAALVRAAESGPTWGTGAPLGAASRYATAAELSSPDVESGGLPHTWKGSPDAQNGIPGYGPALETRRAIRCHRC